MAANITATVPLLLVAAATTAHAQTQGYPSRPIRMIATFPTGGGTDVVARIVSQKLGEALGQHIVVENRAGANGNIGTEAVARATPDGYTLGMGSSATLAINPSLYRLSFDPAKDLAPIIKIASYSYIVVARAALPVGSFRELVAYAREHPGKVNFASSGSATQLVGALLRSTTGMQFTDIPFYGSAPALVQLLGGHVDIMMSGALNAVQPHFKSGLLKPLAVTSPRRSTDLPDVPTVAESGVPGFEVGVWYGVIAPAGTPRNIVTHLNDRLGQILKAPDVKERVAATGSEIVGGTPDEFAASLKAEIGKWARVVRESGIRVQ